MRPRPIRTSERVNHLDHDIHEINRDFPFAIFVNFAVLSSPVARSLQWRMTLREALRLLPTVLVALMVPGVGAQRQAPISFDTYFIPSTMRVDYFHTGGLGSEIFALDRVV